MIENFEDVTLREEIVGWAWILHTEKLPKISRRAYGNAAAGALEFLQEENFITLI